MSDPLFLYGPLCHAPLRGKVLGLGHSVAEARLNGYHRGRLRGTRQPAIVPGSGEVVGLLVTGLDDKARARADYFAAVLGYVPVTVKAKTGRLGSVAAQAYAPEATVNPEALDGEWDLGQWSDDLGPVWVEAAHEVMAAAGQADPAGMAEKWPTMCMRAATRQRAGQGAPAEVRADMRAGRDVEILKLRTPYTEYFSLEDPDLRFRRFDGNWSNPVRRAAFVGSDAATVLPYDPVLDSVLVIEQFRTGPLVRGDPRPWSLEPVAGRIDPGETPEDTARREAREEAGIDLGPMHKVAEYYPSPGAMTEFLFSFVAEADLAGQDGAIGGVAGEDEDIRAHVIPFERVMDMVTSGEAGTGPLILSCYWLALNRLRLWG